MNEANEPKETTMSKIELNVQVRKGDCVRASATQYGIPAGMYLMVTGEPYTDGKELWVEVEAENRYTEYPVADLVVQCAACMTDASCRLNDEAMCAQDAEELDRPESWLEFETPERSASAWLASLRQRVLNIHDGTDPATTALLDLLDGKFRGVRTAGLATAIARKAAIVAWADDYGFNLTTLEIIEEGE